MKAFLSAQVDTYRASYGRTARDYPRQAIFIGSTNADHYLKDETGGRRFLPVRVGAIDVAGIERVREQLWAEAHVRFGRGEAWHLVDPALVRAAKEEQEARYQADPWEAQISKWLREPSEEGKRRRSRGVSTTDVLRGALKIDPGKMTRSDEMRAGAVLRRLRWGRTRVSSSGGRTYLYLPAAARAVVEDRGPAGARAGEAKVGQTKRRVSRPKVPTALPALPSSRRHTGEQDQDRDPVTDSTDPVGQVGQVGRRGRRRSLRLVQEGGAR